MDFEDSAVGPLLFDLASCIVGEFCQHSAKQCIFSGCSFFPVVIARMMYCMCIMCSIRRVVNGSFIPYILSGNCFDAENVLNVSYLKSLLEGYLPRCSHIGQGIYVYVCVIHINPIHITSPPISYAHTRVNIL